MKYRRLFSSFYLMGMLLICATAYGQPEHVKKQLSEADGYYLGKKYPDAKAIYLKHVEHLSPAQQMKLGICYYAEGVKTPQSYSDGMKWMEQSANRGYTEAMNTIAYFYQTGFGVAKDSLQQLAWIKKSAEYGDPEALVSMAYRYQTGRAVPKDQQKAREMYIKAIDRNSAKAGYYLSMMEEQNGNMANALQYMENSARKGFVPAQYELGVMYQEGIATGKNDPDEAYRWFSKIKYSSENQDLYRNAALRMRDMGAVEPSTDMATVKPLLTKLAARANESFYDVKGKLIEPANKPQFDNLGSSKNEYYASLIDLGFKNAYIRRNNFNQLQKDQSIKNVDQYIYHAQLIHSSAKEKTYRVYKQWAGILKNIFTDWKMSEEDNAVYYNGSLSFWKDNSNGRRTWIQLKTCCSNEIVQIEISNL
jgi:TPR repeat protein